MNFSTADLFDDFEDQLQSCELSFQNFGGIKSFFGQISTIRCHEDNSLIRQTLSESVQGRVLVIDGAGSLRRALVGDMIAELARGNGWSGIVVYGAIRDSVAIGNLQIGFKALVRILVKVPKLDLASKTYLSNLETSPSHQTIGFIAILME